MVRRYLRPGDTVVDVGANEGAYAIICAQLVGDEGRVIAVEPIPLNTKRLALNAAINELGNVEIVQAAVSDRNGEISFTINRAPGGSSEHIAQVVDANTKQFSARSVTLDYLCGDNVVSLLEMDIEGAEPLALEGAVAMLAGHRCLLIIMEFVEKFMNRYGLSGEDTVKRLEDLGYQLATYDGANNRLTFGLSERISNSANVLAISRKHLDLVCNRLSCSVVYANQTRRL